MISFILNNKPISTKNPEGMVLLDFIRTEQRLMGTKIGCREGDCGACTVLEGKLVNGTVQYKSILSCLTPLGNVHGKRIVTIEGLEKESLSPVQQAIHDKAATQCGFCTPGFIMSMTAHSLKNATSDMKSIRASVSGNICRCTGYKSIEKAAEEVNHELETKPLNNTTEWLVQHGFVPEYFLTIAERLKEIKAGHPNKKGIPLGGGTDLFVQKADPLYYSELNLLQDNPELKKITFNKNRCCIGASVTAGEMMENQELLQHFPEWKTYFKLISSEPVRNMGTLAGNIVNASPIADLVILFLALDSTLHLKNEKGITREIPLRECYKGYKQLGIEPGEIIENISFQVVSNSAFNFEKVSKRTHLDIASVNTAIQLGLNEGMITQAHVSAGGVFPYPFYADKTVDFLKGKPLQAQTVKAASKILMDEIAPISDIRGTKEYKSLLLRQLFFAHFVKLFPKAISFVELIEQPAQS